MAASISSPPPLPVSSPSPFLPELSFKHNCKHASTATSKSPQGNPFLSLSNRSTPTQRFFCFKRSYRLPTRHEVNSPPNGKGESHESDKGGVFLAENAIKVANFDLHHMEQKDLELDVNEGVPTKEIEDEKLVDSGKRSGRLHVGDFVKKVMSLPVEERVKVLDLLECDDKLLTISDYNDILTALVKAKEFDSAVALFSQLSSCGVLPDAWTFSVMVQCLCKKNEPEEAKRILDEMMGSGFNPNVVTFTELISCMCKRGRITQAFEVFEIMRRIGCEPTIRTYNCLINGLCYVGRVEEALQLLDKIKRSSKRPDIYTFTLVMDGFCKVGRSDEARQLLEEAKEMGLVPNNITYNALIGGYCMEGRPLEALQVLKEMEEGSCSPDFISYNTLLQGLLRFGQIPAAFDTYKKMIDSGYQAPERILNTLLRGLCRGSARDNNILKEAKELFENIPRFGYQLSPYTYCLMVQALAEGREVSLSFRYLLEMVRSGYSPRMLTYNIVLRVLCREGRVDDASHVLVLMLGKTKIPSRFSFSVLIDELQRQGRLLDAFAIYAAAVKLGVLLRRKPGEVLRDGKPNVVSADA